MDAIPDLEERIPDSDEDSGGFKDGTSTSVKDAIKSVDTILHALGRGTLKIWLRMLVRDLQGGEPDLVTARRKAEQDLE